MIASVSIADGDAEEIVSVGEDIRRMMFREVKQCRINKKRDRK
jgi:hypothetical protein